MSVIFVVQFFIAKYLLLDMMTTKYQQQPKYIETYTQMYGKRKSIRESQRDEKSIEKYVCAIFHRCGCW